MEDPKRKGRSRTREVATKVEKHLSAVLAETSPRPRQRQGQMPRAGIPRVVLSGLHDDGNGRIDAQKVAAFMGLPLKRLSEGLGLNYKVCASQSFGGRIPAGASPRETIIGASP